MNLVKRNRLKGTKYELKEEDYQNSQNYDFDIYGFFFINDDFDL